MKKLILIFGFGLLVPMISGAQEPTDTVVKSLVGHITFHSWSVVKMQVTEFVEMPAVNEEGELSKSFNTTFLGAQVTGWMSIGKMKVTAVSKDIITFTLLEELSVIVENGVKKNHFEIGNEVKFVW